MSPRNHALRVPSRDLLSFLGRIVLNGVWGGKNQPRQVAFYLRLFFYRARRLLNQYKEVRDTSGSALIGLFFVGQFLVKRLSYLRAHMQERQRIPAVRAQIERFVPRRGPAFAIKLIGGVGDCLIAARFLRDLAERVELFSFDIYCGHPQMAEWIFRSVPGFNLAYSEFLFDEMKPLYDASLALGHAVVIEVPDFASRGLAESPLLRESLRDAVEKALPLREFAARQPTLDNQLAHTVVAYGAARMSFSHKIFGLTPETSRYALHTDPAALDRHGLRGTRYVTVHNGYDQNVVVLHRLSTKFYPHFSEVVAAAKLAFPDVKFVQIGTSSSTPVTQIDVDLVGRTTLPEVAAVIGGALCHLDVESGLVHMANCLGTPATVVFGPTPIDYFGYPEYRNIAPQSCGDCWATQDTWMALCPRGYKVPVCTQQPPEIVAQALIESLGNALGLSKHLPPAA